MGLVWFNLQILLTMVLKEQLIFLNLFCIHGKASTLNGSGRNVQNMHAWRRKLKGGKTRILGVIWVGLMRVEKIMVLDWG